MRTKVLIRFDDICPTMDSQQWNRAMNLIETYNVKPLLGVIPDCKDSDLLIDEYDNEFWQKIRSLQMDGVAIAMHGFIHVYDSDKRGEVNHSHHSEFAGHTYEMQCKKIREGKEVLNSHGIETDIFFAPAHSYDENTIKALAANGFKYMSDGLGIKAVERHGIKCLPCHFCGSKLPFKCRYVTYVFHAHEWTTKRNAGEYYLLESVCRKYKNDIVDFPEYAEQPIGNVFIQDVIQRIVVSYNRYVWPIILKIYYIVKRLKK